MLHIPIFIGTTLVLRDACARALEALPLSTSSLASLLPTSPDSLLSPAALSHLHELASTSFLWCPSLILPDPTMALPLAVGLAAMLNVEVTAVTRRANAAAARALDEVTVQREQSKHRAADAVGSSLSAAEQRRLSAKRARMGQGRGFATATTRPQVGPPGQEVVEKEEEPRTARIMTNVLRGAAVCFIPVAAFAPSVRTSQICKLSDTMTDVYVSSCRLCASTGSRATRTPSCRTLHWPSWIDGERSRGGSRGFWPGEGRQDDACIDEVVLILVMTVEPRVSLCEVTTGCEDGMWSNCSFVANPPRSTELQANALCVLEVRWLFCISPSHCSFCLGRAHSNSPRLTSSHSHLPLSTPLLGHHVRSQSAAMHHPYTR